jgi:hypothetical protein
MADSNYVTTYYPVGPTPPEEHMLKPLDSQNEMHKTTEAIPADNNHYQWMIVAKKRSGKSTLILQVLYSKFKNHFTDIFFYSPTAAYDPKYEPLVTLLKKRGTFITSFTKDSLESTIAQCISNRDKYERAMKTWEERMKDPDCPPSVKEIFRREKPEEPRHLIVFDDCVDKFGSHSDYGHPIQRIFNNGFHLRCSVWVASQQFKALTPAMRKNMDMISFFKISNQDEINHICSEINAPRDVFLKAYKQSTDIDYGFLHVNWIRKSSVPSFFSKFTPIIIPPEELDVVGRELNEPGQKRKKPPSSTRVDSNTKSSIKKKIITATNKLLHEPRQNKTIDSILSDLIYRTQPT